MPRTQTTTTDTQSELQQCIELCLACARMCTETALTFCLPRGGRHADATHIGQMLGCAAMCRTAADFMLMDNKLLYKVCGVCAEVCEACAVSCSQLDDMEECVDHCRRCADSCRRLALGTAAEL